MLKISADLLVRQTISNYELHLPRNDNQQLWRGKKIKIKKFELQIKESKESLRS